MLRELGQESSGGTAKSGPLFFIGSNPCSLIGRQEELQAVLQGDKRCVDIHGDSGGAGGKSRTGMEALHAFARVKATSSTPPKPAQPPARKGEALLSQLYIFM